MMCPIPEVLRFLNYVDADFRPALSDKTVLEDFAAKICELAHPIIRRNDEGIYGLVVLYCNDLVMHRAYISLVGVKEEYRGRGVAKDMMQEAMSVAKAAGMTKIGIHSNNPNAVALYANLGFEIIEDGERKYMEYEL